VNLALTKEGQLSTELLRASEAARRLEMSTKDLLRLVLRREIRYEMVDGIAHVPTDALEEYRAKASEFPAAPRFAVRIRTGSAMGDLRCPSVASDGPIQSAIDNAPAETRTPSRGITTIRVACGSLNSFDHQGSADGIHPAGQWCHCQSD
jgi:hypothetical protein